MTAIPYFNGPKVLQHNPLGYCFICAMSVKGLALDALKAEMARVTAMEEDKIVWLDMPARDLPLSPAVAYGLFGPWTVPQFGVNGNGQMPFPVPLCWTHMLGARITASNLAQGTASDAAQLDRLQKRGPGGAVPLG
jgi:hypothetical protein